MHIWWIAFNNQLNETKQNKTIHIRTKYSQYTHSLTQWRQKLNQIESKTKANQTTPNSTPK